MVPAPDSGMNFASVKALSAKLFLQICVCVLLGTVVSVSGGSDRYDDDSDLMNMDVKHLWDLLRLSSLSHPLNQRLLQSPESKLQLEGEQTEGMEGEQTFSPKSRQKRLGVAGLDNLDVMTKTLDRQRKFPMMSVSNMGTNRLRMLMAQAGRK